MLGQVCAQGLQQGGIFSEAFHQNLPCAIECCFGVWHARIVDAVHRKRRFQKPERGFFRGLLRIVEQTFRQSGQSRFRGDLRLGATLDLERQIQVFQASLVFCVRQQIVQRRRHFVLLFDRRDDRAAARFQLTQITQPFFEQAQLDIVEAASGFFTVPRNKRHRRAFVQQGDGSGDLDRFGGKFYREALFDCW